MQKQPKTWFISDTHFYHAGIIDYDGRPWKNVEDMNEGLIRNWNEYVDNVDTVWFLGDLSWESKKSLLQPIVGRLHGRKMMIKGNHDKKSDSFYRDLGFEFVSPYPVILKGFFILSHAPVFVNRRAPFFNIFGHVHNLACVHTHEENNSLCVCACRTGYHPVRCLEYDNAEYSSTVYTYVPECPSIYKEQQ